MIKLGRGDEVEITSKNKENINIKGVITDFEESIGPQSKSINFKISCVNSVDSKKKYEFKIGDEVEHKEYKSFGKGKIIKKNQFASSVSWDVKFDKYNLTRPYQASELKLLPKLKTLIELWEECDRYPFRAINKQGIKDRFIGVDGKNGAYCDDNSEWQSNVAEWQLYQEPEEEKPAEKCEHKNVNETFEGDYCKDCEIELINKCEHLNATQQLNDKWYCDGCGVELEERWLWYINEGDVWYLYTVPQTLKEIIKHCENGEEDRLRYKQATNSRELFEVKNEKLA